MQLSKQLHQNKIKLPHLTSKYKHGSKRIPPAVKIRLSSMTLLFAIPIWITLALYLSISHSLSPNSPQEMNGLSLIHGNEPPMQHRRRYQHLASRADPTAPAISATERICYKTSSLPLIALGVVFVVLGLQLMCWSALVLMRRRKGWWSRHLRN